jgi:hypothetical protein
MPSYSGVWSLSQQFQGRGQGLWPQPPGAPTIGTATLVTTTSATVAFTPPACVGSPAPTYEAVSSPGCITSTGASSPISVTGLTAGTAYTFRVRAQNTATGYGAYSASSNSVQARVPGAPTIGTATAGACRSATVSFSAPACVGSPGGITSYTVTSTPGCITASGGSSPLSVTGLTGGTSYTFKAKATNAYGTGACSAASNSITALVKTCVTYGSPGTYSWVVPSGVTSIAAVTIGAGAGAGNFTSGFGGAGGGLAYGNGISVTPGETLTIIVGSGGPGGSSTSNGSFSAVRRGSCNLVRATAGGTGGPGSFSNGTSGQTGGYGNSGGGGAAGYTGGGGSGGSYSSNGSAGSGGGAGGGGGGSVRCNSPCPYTNYYGSGGGGGTGLFGQGTSGAGGVAVPSCAGTGGRGGSGGSAGYGSCLCGGYAGCYGGGGGRGGAQTYGGCYTYIASGASGAGGGVRIVWAGFGRGTPSFPSTNVGA